MTDATCSPTFSMSNLFSIVCDGDPILRSADISRDLHSEPSRVTGLSAAPRLRSIRIDRLTEQRISPDEREDPHASPDESGGGVET